MPKVVIDTSVFLAGLLTTNPISSSAQVIQLWKAGTFTLIMSPQILREIVAKAIDKGVSDEALDELVESIGSIAMLIPGVCESTRLTKIDPGDNVFLAAAYESHADYIVSLDNKSLLPLKHFHGAQICTPHLFLRIMMDSF